MGSTNSKNTFPRRPRISMSMALMPALVFSSAVFAASPAAACEQPAAALEAQACPTAQDAAQEDSARLKRGAASLSNSVTGVVSPVAKFDGACTSLTPADLEAAGFRLGDSVDIAFSNGHALSDVPYFSGYYVKKGEPFVVAYPGFEFVHIGRNNSEFWTPAGLSQGDTVTISLNTAGKYLPVMERLNQVYQDDRDAYASDVEFANFRALSGGRLKRNFLYRGASPVDNCHKRAATVDRLVERAGVTSIVDLADSKEDMASYLGFDDFASPYAKSIHENGRTALLGMGTNYETETYRAGVAAAARQLIGSDGPVYIHCMEGKDRTGFVCMLLEALSGASVGEMRADYMQSYANYYGINEAETPEAYAAVSSLYFDDFLDYLSSLTGEERGAADYAVAARAYLSTCGLADETTDALAAAICA